MKQSMHAKRMARAHKRQSLIPKLNLVSLMDIFTILVFFLLVNSSDVEVLQTNKDIELPKSIAEQKPKENLMVMVSDETILVGGRKVADVASILQNENREIKGLKTELAYQASRKPFTSTEDEEKGRDITIMADKDIPYALLKRIMTTCAESEFRNISLAVSQVLSSSGDSPSGADLPVNQAGG